MKLAPERQHQVSLLQRVASQAGSDLVRLVAPHCTRVEDEDQTPIQNAPAASAGIEAPQLAPSDRRNRGPLWHLPSLAATPNQHLRFSRSATAGPGTGHPRRG